MSNTRNLPSSKLQLFGTVAIHIACKFEVSFFSDLKYVTSLFSFVDVLFGIGLVTLLLNVVCGPTYAVKSKEIQI